MKIEFLRHWLTRPEKPLPIGALELLPLPEDPEAQFNLGRQLSSGESGSQDPARAVECFEKAALQGHLLAQYHLGLMYAQGKGVLRKEATALLWLRKAAEQGHAGAQYHLGVKLHRASKTLRQEEACQNRIEAFKFLQLALSQQHKAAESALEFVALGMTQLEVDEAQRRALAFNRQGSPEVLPQRADPLTPP